MALLRTLLFLLTCPLVVQGSLNFQCLKSTAHAVQRRAETLITFATDLSTPVLSTADVGTDLVVAKTYLDHAHREKVFPTYFMLSMSIIVVSNIATVFLFWWKHGRKVLNYLHTLGSIAFRRAYFALLLIGTVLLSPLLPLVMWNWSRTEDRDEESKPRPPFQGVVQVTKNAFVLHEETAIITLPEAMPEGPESGDYTVLHAVRVCVAPGQPSHRPHEGIWIMVSRQARKQDDVEIVYKDGTMICTVGHPPDDIAFDPFSNLTQRQQQQQQRQKHRERSGIKFDWDVGRNAWVSDDGVANGVINLLHMIDANVIEWKKEIQGSETQRLTYFLLSSESSQAFRLKTMTEGEKMLVWLGSTAAPSETAPWWNIMQYRMELSLYQQEKRMQKLMIHLPFIVEATCEATPQALLQISAITIEIQDGATDVSMWQYFSIGLSLLTLMSKVPVLCQSVFPELSFWKASCVCFDITMLFYTFSAMWATHEWETMAVKVFFLSRRVGPLTAVYVYLLFVLVIIVQILFWAVLIKEIKAARTARNRGSGVCLLALGTCVVPFATGSCVACARLSIIMAYIWWIENQLKNSDFHANAGYFAHAGKDFSARMKAVLHVMSGNPQVTTPTLFPADMCRNHSAGCKPAGFLWVCIITLMLEWFFSVFIFPTGTLAEAIWKRVTYGTPVCPMMTFLFSVATCLFGAFVWTTVHSWSFIKYVLVVQAAEPAEYSCPDVGAAMDAVNSIYEAHYREAGSDEYINDHREADSRLEEHVAVPERHNDGANAALLAQADAPLNAVMADGPHVSESDALLNAGMADSPLVSKADAPLGAVRRRTAQCCSVL